MTHGVETGVQDVLRSTKAELLPLRSYPQNQRRLHRPDRESSRLANRFSGVVRCVASTRWIVSLVIAGGFPGNVSAQDSWNFSSEVPCATTPVQGLPFQKCLISNVRTFRVGTVQAWRLTFTEPKSEFAIGFYKMVEAHGVGGMSPVSSSSMAEWVRTADALKNITSGGTGWASGGDSNARYVTFQRGPRQCLAFVHNGPMVNGQVNWILGAAFCRDSVSPIQFSEAQFIADAIQVRD